MALELHQTNLRDIQIGDFPLNHDCILKLVYTPGTALRFQYFTCRSQDSGTLSLILSQVFCVKKVICISVDDFS